MEHLATTFTYIHRDSAGAVLYVGYTGEPVKRWAVHKCRSPWFSKIATVELRRWRTRDAAMAEEKRLIGLHNPPHNNQHVKSIERRRARRRAWWAAHKVERNAYHKNWRRSKSPR